MYAPDLISRKDRPEWCPLKEQPKIVLCKDCRYWQDNNNGYPHPDCRWGHDETPDPDDYCSFGERKEGR